VCFIFIGVRWFVTVYALQQLSTKDDSFLELILQESTHQHETSKVRQSRSDVLTLKIHFSK
jgi:hypothetical protein